MGETTTSPSLQAAFQAAFLDGRVCLHPTDTVPGLTFDPESVTARQALATLKRRPETKPCLGLAASFAIAETCFRPLPAGWREALMRLWPGPLSVVWAASESAPRGLVATDGTIGLRVPRLPAEAAWFKDVLVELGRPVPTTSVNEGGEPPATAFTEAKARFSRDAVYQPDWVGTDDVRTMPSTVIRLAEDGTYVVLRDGAMPRATIEAALRPEGAH